MQAMNGSLFLGRTLRVRWASNKQTKPQFRSNDDNQLHGPSVFVVFLVYQKQLVVNEIILRSVFEAFGSVVDVVVKQSKIDVTTGQQKGYAFVQYTADWQGIDAAMAAVANLDNLIIDGVGYKCEVSYHTEELRHQLIVTGVPPPPGCLSCTMTSINAPALAPMHVSPPTMTLSNAPPPGVMQYSKPSMSVLSTGPPMLTINTHPNMLPPPSYKMDSPMNMNMVTWNTSGGYGPAIYPPPVLIPSPTAGSAAGFYYPSSNNSPMAYLSSSLEERYPGALPLNINHYRA
eukprot:scaffold340_cov177-Ochromonas_danica.AAC.8